MASQITRGRNLGPTLLKALGYDLDIHRVKSFAIYWRADGPPLIRVTEYATVAQEEAVVALVATADAPNLQAV